MILRKTFTKKAFTLIELLAVIVILGIILLIAIPRISNVIEKADEEARVLSVKGFADAVKIAVDKYKLSNTAPFNLSDLTIETTPDTVDCLYMNYDEEAGVVLRECKVKEYDKKYYYVNKIVYDNAEGFNSAIIDNGYDMALLADASDLIASTDLNPGTFSGTGTSADPYLIESVEDLVAISKNVNIGTTYSGKYFSLKLSLDFSNTKSYVNSTNTTYGDINGNGQTEGLLVELTTSKGFLPIGNNTNKFLGNILGNNYSLYNLYINRNDLSYVGFIGYNAGTIRNLNFDNANIVGSNYTAVAAGYNDLNIIDIEIDGNVTGNNYVGLVTGYLPWGDDNKAIGIMAKGNVTGVDNVGGFVGYMDNYSDLRGIFLEGSVMGTTSKVGRVVGDNYWGDKRVYALKTNSVKGVAVTSTDIMGNNGADINVLSDVTADINAAELVFDTYIGGDNDSDGYYWDYNESGVLVERNTTAYPLTFSLSGSGTTGSPYIINNYEDLKMATQKLNMVYSINNDIDLNGKKFYMIGSEINRFTGTIIGNQHIINNMNINAAKTSYVGFTGYNNGTIRNLTFDNANIVGSNYTAIVAGYNDLNIIDIEINGNVIGNNYVGLVTGFLPNGDDNKAIGIIAKGNVTGVDNVGGFVGYMDNYSDLRGVFLAGTVTGTTSKVGRVIGDNYWGDKRVYALKTNSVKGVAVTSTDIMGNNGADINVLSDVTTDINAAELVFDTYIGGDNDSDGYYWDYNESGVLVEKNTTANPLTFSLSGSGTTGSPYLINNYEDLKMATQKLNMVYSINSDIDLNGKKFYMMGSEINRFTGTIIGNQHIINNMNINAAKTSYVGFTGYNNGTIRNLTFDNANIVGSNYTSIVAGYNNHYIIDVEIDGNVTGNNYVGLVTGYLPWDDNSKAIGIIATGNVTGVDYVGGFAGYIDNTADLRGVFLTGTVTGTTSRVGRVVGANYWGDKRVYVLKTNLLNGITVTSTVVDSNNGADINNLSDVINNINVADLALDTYIGGDNDSDGYYWDYNESGTLVERNTTAYPLTFSLSGSGTSASPYVVNNLNEWKQINLKLTSTYQLISSRSSFSSSPYYTLGSGWNTFTGVIIEP